MTKTLGEIPSEAQVKETISSYESSNEVDTVGPIDILG